MNPTRTYPHGLLAVGLGLWLAGSSAAMNIVEKLSSRPEFSTLVTAVTEAGLVDTLAEAEDVTVFAPDNAAFARIPKADLDALLADPEALTRVLTYHVAPGSTRFAEFTSGPLETLLEGESVEVDVKSVFQDRYRRVHIDEIPIIRADIEASNGVIHQLGRVLDPDARELQTILGIVAGNPDFSILADLVKQAGFEGALGRGSYRLTVFAPTNAAFEALGEETLATVQADGRLLREVLRNHIAFGAFDSAALAEAGSVHTLLDRDLKILPDASATAGFSIDGQPLEEVDIEASNGLVHVVGGVLLPDLPQSLVDLADSREDLSTLATALDAAGLAPALDSTRKWPAYTIFAPDNLAFDALPEGALEELLADPTGALAGVLKLHVVRGRLESSFLQDGQVLTSLSGERLEVSIQGGAIRINDAAVKEPDLYAANGVIHIVDAVISPGDFTLADFVGEKPYLSTLKAALDAAGLSDALDDPESQLTLFAPLNYAFARLPTGTLQSLLEDPSGELTRILLYHVVEGSLSARQLAEAGGATTLQGGTVRVDSRAFRFWGWRLPYSIITVNGTRLVATDIETDNGTVHLLSGVLLPNGSAE